MYMGNEVREPKQARSIEKKSKIINAAYQLFSEVGYYGTNTAEIAKRAGVSTGIVYGYFRDKQDILINVLNQYINDAFLPVINILDNCTAVDFSIVPTLLDEVILTHKKYSKIHEALHSLTSTEEGVRNEFLRLENLINEKLATKMKEIGFNENGLNEKIHLAMNLVQSFSHEYVFDQHDYIDYEVMKQYVTTMITDLFKFHN